MSPRARAEAALAQAARAHLHLATCAVVMRGSPEGSPPVACNCGQRERLEAALCEMASVLGDVVDALGPAPKIGAAEVAARAARASAGECVAAANWLATNMGRASVEECVRQVVVRFITEDCGV